jgi:hypothetical protein
MTGLTPTNTYGRTLLAVAEAPVPFSVWDYTPYTCGYAQDTVRATLDELASKGLTSRVEVADGLAHFALTAEGKAVAARLAARPARS